MEKDGVTRIYAYVSGEHKSIRQVYPRLGAQMRGPNLKSVVDRQDCLLGRGSQGQPVRVSSPRETFRAFNIDPPPKPFAEEVAIIEKQLGLQGLTIILEDKAPRRG